MLKLTRMEGIDVSIQDENLTFWPPPPGALKFWPGCKHPEPLPGPGIYRKMYTYIWYIVPVLHLVFGTFGNVMTALIIVRNVRKMTSTSVMLLALAISDTVCLYNGLLRNWVNIIWKIDIRGLTDITCKVSVLVLYSSYQSSAWFLVALTAERLFCILKPHKVKLHFTAKKSTIAIMIITLIITAQNSHVFYGFGIELLDAYKGHGDCLVTRESYVDFYRFHLSWIHFGIGYLIPCVLIIAGNCMIIYKLRQSLKRKDKLILDNITRQRNSTQHHLKQGNSLTAMLILLSSVFFISQTPVAVFFMCEAYVIQAANQYACNNFQEYMRRAEIIKFVEALCVNFGLINASMNFVLYVISGSRFREDAKALLLCRHNGRAHTVFTDTS